MTLLNGYQMVSTFITDFSIADVFGESAVKYTYARVFREWKDDYVYLTELVITLNLKLWEHYNLGNMHLPEVYRSLWEKADEYACDTLTGDAASFFFRVTD